MGASYKGTTLKNQNSSEKVSTGSFDYLALAFPAGKVNVAAGIMPYSFVGYNIQNIGTDGDFTEARQYQGDGGLNRAFLGLSYRINKNFSNTDNFTCHYYSHSIRAHEKEGTHQRWRYEIRGIASISFYKKVKDCATW